MNASSNIALNHQALEPNDAATAVESFADQLVSRRSVRHFSTQPVDLRLIKEAIRAAGQAPSGANKQPWKFVVVTNPEIKRAIREGAEKEERAFYSGRAGEQWLADLEPLGTGPQKPFLEDAPALIVLMAETRAEDDSRHYYVKESVGIAAGFLLAALHLAGLTTLTHTPSPMGFLNNILKRPAHERPFLLIPVGYPTSDCQVPNIDRKALEDILVEIR